MANLTATQIAALHRDVGKHAALAMGYGTFNWLPQSRGNHDMAMNESNETRFRSFCERYVIARAATFRVGHEEEDIWTCMLNAKSAYRRIEAMGRGVTKEDNAMAEAAAQDAQSPSVAMPSQGSMTGRYTGPKSAAPAGPLLTQSMDYSAIEKAMLDKMAREITKATDRGIVNSIKRYVKGATV